MPPLMQRYFKFSAHILVLRHMSIGCWINYTMLHRLRPCGTLVHFACFILQCCIQVKLLDLFVSQIILNAPIQYSSVSFWFSFRLSKSIQKFKVFLLLLPSFIYKRQLVHRWYDSCHLRGKNGAFKFSWKRFTQRLFTLGLSFLHVSYRISLWVDKPCPSLTLCSCQTISCNICVLVFFKSRYLKPFTNLDTRKDLELAFSHRTQERGQKITAFGFASQWQFCILVWKVVSF